MNVPPAKRWSLIQTIKETAAGWTKHRALNLSAALAYYSIFSIAPLLIIAIAVAGMVFGPEAAQGKVSAELRSYIGGPGATGVESLVKSAAKPGQGWIGATTGIITLLLGASGVFGQLKEALNTIWGVEQKPGSGLKGIIRERLLSFGMVLVIGFLLLTSLLLTTIMAGVSGYLNHLLGIPAAVWSVASFLVSFGVVLLLFAMIFKILPDANVRWKDVWVGATATAVLFEIGKFGLSYYLGRESTASSYGAAGSIILVLLWIYYASCILLFGAEFTRVYALAHGHEIRPSANAQAVSASTAPTSAPAAPEIPAPAKEHLPIDGIALPPVRAAASAPPFYQRMLKGAGLVFGAFLIGRLTKKSETPAGQEYEYWHDLNAELEKAETKSAKR